MFGGVFASSLPSGVDPVKLVARREVSTGADGGAATGRPPSSDQHPHGEIGRPGTAEQPVRAQRGVELPRRKTLKTVNKSTCACPTRSGVASL